MQLIIPIHSFVDLITNSSSEIFVAADGKTVSTLKKLVNLLIQTAQPGVPTLTADDLFEIDLVYTCTDGNYDEHYLSKDEIKAKRKEIEKRQAELEKHDELNDTEQAELDALQDWRFGDGDSGDYPQSSVRVKAKNKDDKAAVQAAKILSDLTGLFEINASYS